MSNFDFDQLRDKIFENTNGGFDVIRSLYPTASIKKNFRIEADDRNPSVSLHRQKNGVYTMHVWNRGEMSKGRNAIQIYADYHGISFGKATVAIGKEYKLYDGASFVPVVKKSVRTWYKTNDWKEGDFDDTNFLFECKEYTDDELKYLGPFVTAEVAEKYGFYSLKWFATKSEKGVMKIESTEHYPIFIRIGESKEVKHYKVIQPYYKPEKDGDPNYKYLWKGKKPKDFIGGIKILEIEYKDGFDKRHAEASIAEEEATDVDKIESESKIDKVFICAGERDALNMASLGYFVLWMNSETSEITLPMFRRITKCAKEVYNIPDLDETGIREGKKKAFQYIDLRTWWLPKELQEVDTYNGKKLKDTTDYFVKCAREGYNRITMGNLVEKKIKYAFPIQFWGTYFNKKKISVTFSPRKFLYFLSMSGYAAIRNQETLVYQRGNILEQVSEKELKTYTQKFLQENYVSLEVLDYLMTSDAAVNRVFGMLPDLNCNWNTGTPTAQYLLFSDKAWEVTKDGIKEVSHENIPCHAYVDELIDNKIKSEMQRKLDDLRIKKEEPYFKIKKVGKLWDIKILDKDVEFLNFLIQTSRMFWKDEVHEEMHENRFSDEYWTKENNLFDIEGPRLTKGQITIQKQHLVNKLFTLGYMVHQFKIASKAWFVMALENHVIEDGRSEGRSGKSLIFEALKSVFTVKVIDGKKQNIWKDDFLYEGVNERTALVLFDDVRENFDVSNLYARTTGGFTVNEKQVSKVHIPFREAAKIGISSNFSPGETDSSADDRTLFIGTSDYYHGNKGSYDYSWKPSDDFKHEFFLDWNGKQWNKQINLLAQACQFYLSVSEKINPPMESLRKRQFKQEMRDGFKEFADEYLQNKLNQEISYKSVLEVMKEKDAKKFSFYNQATLKSKLAAWAGYYGFEKNPKSIYRSGRIQRKVDDVRLDFFYMLGEWPNMDQEDIIDETGI